MAPVVHTPVKGFTGTVAGVNFADGAGETDDPVALRYFRSAGYEVGRAEPSGPVAPVAPVAPVVPVAPTAPVAPVAPVGREPERPHPVQGSKALWFEYLSKIKPDHGFDLEKVSRKELIEAVEAIEGE